MKPIRLGLILLALTALISGHGLYIQVGQQAPFVSIRAVYEGDIPIPFAAFTIRAPGGEEFQNGRTDRLGRVVFRPDQTGLWKVTVDDEMGHLQSIELVLNMENGDNPDQSSPRPDSPWLKWLLGVSLILLLTTALALWKKRA
jgi:hypothetical protein